jgi:hypothetical protein
VGDCRVQDRDCRAVRVGMPFPVWSTTGERRTRQQGTGAGVRAGHDSLHCKVVTGGNSRKYSCTASQAESAQLALKAFGGLSFTFNREHMVVQAVPHALSLLWMQAMSSSSLRHRPRAHGTRHVRTISTQPAPSPCCLRMMSHVVGAP